MVVHFSDLNEHSEKRAYVVDLALRVNPVSFINGGSRSFRPSAPAFILFPNGQIFKNCRNFGDKLV